jgi:hypothetical protein
VQESLENLEKIQEWHLAHDQKDTATDAEINIPGRSGPAATKSLCR